MTRRINEYEQDTLAKKAKGIKSLVTLVDAQLDELIVALQDFSVLSAEIKGKRGEIEERLNTAVELLTTLIKSKND